MHGTDQRNGSIGNTKLSNSRAECRYDFLVFLYLDEVHPIS